jgi:hypothetical protein
MLFWQREHLIRYWFSRRITKFDGRLNWSLFGRVMSPVTSPLQATHWLFGLFWTQNEQYKALHSGSTHSSGLFTISTFVYEC